MHSALRRIAAFHKWDFIYIMLFYFAIYLNVALSDAKWELFTLVGFSKIFTREGKWSLWETSWGLVFAEQSCSLGLWIFCLFALLLAMEHQPYLGLRRVCYRVGMSEWTQSFSQLGHCGASLLTGCCCTALLSALVVSLKKVEWVLSLSKCSLFLFWFIWSFVRTWFSQKIVSLGVVHQVNYHTRWYRVGEMAFCFMCPLLIHASATLVIQSKAYVELQTPVNIRNTLLKFLWRNFLFNLLENLVNGLLRKRNISKLFFFFSSQRLQFCCRNADCKASDRRLQQLAMKSLISFPLTFSN